MQSHPARPKRPLLPWHKHYRNAFGPVVQDDLSLPDRFRGDKPESLRGPIRIARRRVVRLGNSGKSRLRVLRATQNVVSSVYFMAVQAILWAKGCYPARLQKHCFVGGGQPRPTKVLLPMLTQRDQAAHLHAGARWFVLPSNLPQPARAIPGSPCRSAHQALNAAARIGRPVVRRN